MVKRIVDTGFWTDMHVMDHYSIEDKYFSLYLLTNGKSTQVGIYALPKKVMSFETGFTSDVIQVLLDRFTKTYGKILYSEKTQEITYLRSLEFSILRGGKPVSDLLERELSKVKDCELILATYEAMLDHWQKSKRAFDQTIQEIFENELTRRGLFQNQTQNQSHIQNHIYNQSQNQNHNQESYHESDATTRSTIRGTSREITKNDDEDRLIERYATYLKSLKPELDIELTKDNIVTVFYTELVEEVQPHTNTTLNDWEKNYPKSFILEALNRSLEANLPLVYANKILENWKKHNITKYQDIIIFDKKHSRNKA